MAGFRDSYAARAYRPRVPKKSPIRVREKITGILGFHGIEHMFGMRPKNRTRVRQNICSGIGIGVVVIHLS